MKATSVTCDARPMNVESKLRLFFFSTAGSRRTSGKSLERTPSSSIANLNWKPLRLVDVERYGDAYITVVQCLPSITAE